MSLVEAMRRPGAEGRRAVLALHASLPPVQHPCLLADLHRWRVDAWAFQYVLVAAWRRRARAVVDAAGSPPVLRAWFRHAAFDRLGVFGLDGRPDLAELPGRLTVYRGGRGDPATLAATHCWSRDPGVAAVFAHALGDDAGGRAVLLRRTVARAGVAAWVPLDWLDEVVLLEPGPWAVELDDPAAIGRLAADYGRLLEPRRSDRPEPVWPEEPEARP
jgi:hypothetical protein